MAHTAGNFSIIHQSEVQEGAEVLPAVWAMRCKCRIKTQEVYKWKAQLNFDGSRMIKGVHYDESFAPVASWGAIRLLLIMVLMHGWSTRQIDYDSAYTQAQVERELYMDIPKGFQIKQEDKSQYTLKIHKNIYGQKQASRVWD